VTGNPALTVALLISSPVFSEELGCGFSAIPEAQIKRGCGCDYHLRTDAGMPMSCLRVAVVADYSGI
jgi:hypothetical protein